MNRFGTSHTRTFIRVKEFSTFQNSLLSHHKPFEKIRFHARPQIVPVHANHSNVNLETRALTCEILTPLIHSHLIISCVRYIKGYIDRSDNDFLQLLHMNSGVVGLLLNMSKPHLLHPYVSIIHDHPSI
jgi:hypothetical protein